MSWIAVKFRMKKKVFQKRSRGVGGGGGGDGVRHFSLPGGDPDRRFRLRLIYMFAGRAEAARGTAAP